MRILLPFALLLAIILLGAKLIITNNQEVTLHLLQWSITTTLMELVIGCVLGGVLVGLLVTLFYNFGSWVETSRRRSREKKDKEIGALYLDGRARLLSRDLKRARAALQKAYDRDRSRPEVAMALAEVELAEGKLDGAKALWQEVHKKNAQEIESLLRLAQASQDHGLVNEAVAAYQEVLKIDRDNPRSLLSLRDLFVTGRRWADALEVQKRLLKQAQGNDAEREKRMFNCLRYEQALELASTDQLDKALAELKDLTKQAPDFAAAAVSLGDVLNRQDKLAEAVKRWQQGYIQFGQGVFLARIEQAYLAAEDPSSLVGAYRSLLKERSGDLMVHLYFGRLCLRLEMVEEALEHLQIVENSGAQFALLHELLAESYRRRDQLAEAVAEYQKALGIDGQAAVGYECDSCGAELGDWLGRCSACGDWDGVRLAQREVMQSTEASSAREIHHGEREAAS